MKPRLSPLCSLLLLLLLATSGCLRSKYPLSAVKGAKADPRLIGRWQSTQPLPKPAKAPAKEEPEIVQISFDERGIGRAQGVFKDGRLGPDDARFFVTRATKNSYLNVQDTRHSKEYEFYRYQVSADGQNVRIWAFRQEPFEEAIKTGRLKGKLNVTSPKEGGSLFGYTLLQSPSNQLLSFVESLPDDQLLLELVSAKRVR